jgi:hypothetical protein
MKPATEQVGIPDRRGLARQDEEDGLERVLGVMMIAQELAADAEYHRPVSRHDGGESALIDGFASCSEPIKKLAVGKPRCRAAIEERSELPGHRSQCQVRHLWDPELTHETPGGRLRRLAFSRLRHPDSAWLALILSHVLPEN